MNIVESTIINVLNYNDSVYVVPTQIKPDGYLFEKCNNDEPYSIPLSFAEIRVINSQSDVFRNGMLRFEKDIEQDVYEKLSIRDWKDILSNDDIKNIILNPSKEGLSRLIKITNASLFEMVRGMFVQLKNSGQYDISMRVSNVINERYSELYRGERISKIQITTVPTQETLQIDTSELIKNEIAKVKAELEAQLRAEYESKLNNAVEDETENNKSDTNNKTNETKDGVKKVGRPKS